MGYRRMTVTSRDLFGHPRGLTFLFSTEMWERFSYYGMKALLVLYMVKHLLLAGNMEQVIGLTTLKSGLEWMFGPLGIQPLSSHIYGLYTGLVYLTPVIGGLLADRWLGLHRTILIGAVLMAIGHFLMAFERLFLVALTLLILGNGAFKPNMSAQVGDLYAPGDPRRDRAYSIFYVGINIGAGLAPLVCGSLGELLGWHYGFTAAGIGMTLALVIYIWGLPWLPSHTPQAAKSSGRAPLDAREWRRVVALMVLFLPTTLFWAAYEQQGNTLALWADDYTDRYVDLLFWKGEIPVTWFQIFNPFMIFAFTPLVVALWKHQARRGREPSTVVKMSIGCFGVALANLVMLGAVRQAAGGADASWLWLLGYFIVVTLGELYLSPIGLSLVSKLAPSHMISMMMGFWLATSFVGNFLAGWLGSFWTSMDKGMFFLMIAGVAVIAGAVILSFDRPLRRIIED
jgi:proton-dependent oligopeptide transporter, POT family